LKGREQKPFFTPERERQIFDKLEEINPGPLSSRQMVNVFREIISVSRAVERQLVCAYWGPPGTFTNLASLKTFGASTDHAPKESIEDVFLAVEHGQADYGVVPVENSVAGIVPETLDRFPQTNVKICAETYIPIHHHLLSTAGSLGEIERVYSGPQPAGQCRRWLRANLPTAEIIEVVPTAKAAERALEDPRGAAIANALAADLFSIPILVEHIEDNARNRTRFLVIGYNEPAKTGNDKTSLLFNLRNRPGELVRALSAFEKQGIDLMMIESRPAQRATFEYIFYCDCAGHRSEAHIQAALEEVKDCTFETTILGSYPMADPLSGSL
jgi:chorismate mutase/prephenate dehydratase